MSEPLPVEEASRYARIRRRLMLLDMAVSALCLIFIQSSGFSHALAKAAHQFSSQEMGAVAAYLALLGALLYLLLLPLHFFSSFVIEHRFHLSRMTVKDWCVRELKQLAVSGILGLLLVEGLYLLLRLAPGSWPLWATAGWVAFSVILARVFPTVLLPIFYKTSPVEDGALVKRLLDLCKKTGLQALGVFRFNIGVETRKANAALAGLGKTRRVLLSDTLMGEFSAEEIEGVLGHELGHHHYRHITKMLLVSAVGSWLAFFLTQAFSARWIEILKLQGLSDVAGFPALMLWLSLLGLLGLPLQNAISRYFEWQCDRFAVTSTQKPAAFASALRRLGELNLADPDPPRWVVWMFYDHPPVSQRIAAAEKTQAA